MQFQRRKRHYYVMVILRWTTVANISLWACSIPQKAYQHSIGFDPDCIFQVQPCKCVLLRNNNNQTPLFCTYCRLYDLSSGELATNNLFVKDCILTWQSLAHPEAILSMPHLCSATNLKVLPAQKAALCMLSLMDKLSGDTSWNYLFGNALQLTQHTMDLFYVMLKELTDSIFGETEHDLIDISIENLQSTKKLSEHQDVAGSVPQGKFHYFCTICVMFFDKCVCVFKLMRP